MKKLLTLLALLIVTPAFAQQTWNYTTIPPSSYTNGVLGPLSNINYNTSNLTWSGVTAPNSTDTFLFGSGTATGTGNADSAPRGRLSFDYFTITDTIQSSCTICTLSGSPSATIAYQWRDYVLNNGWSGYRVPRLDFVTLNNPPAVCTVNGGCQNYLSPNIVVSQQLVNMANHMNGLPYSFAGANGAVFGGNTNVFSNAGSAFDNVTGVWDWEFDLGFNGTGSAWKGLNILLRKSGNRAYEQDNALTIALNTPQTSDQGTFRTVINGGNAYGATAATFGDSTVFGGDRRESGATIKTAPALYVFNSLNYSVTPNGCNYVWVGGCVNAAGNIDVGQVAVTNGIVQQSASIATVNVLSTNYAFTGYITGSVLTTSTGGALARGQAVNCAGCTPTSFQVQGSPASGTGGVGSTYNLTPACTAGCGTSGTPVAMTTGQTALGPFGWTGGGILMVNGSGNMLAFPALSIDPSPFGTSATGKVNGMFLQAFAVPQGFLPANGCSNGDTITVTIPGNGSGTNSTFTVTVSGGNITAGTVVTPGNVVGITGGSPMALSGGTCTYPAAQTALVQALIWGTSSTTLTNVGTGYNCNEPPAVNIGSGHTTSTEVIPKFEAVLSACAQVPVKTAVAVQVPAYTVATLPACAAAIAGSIAYVTDANAPTYNATLTGGSSTTTLALCNGTTWTAH